MSDVLSAVLENGWVANKGGQPVGDNTKVDTRWKDECTEYNHCADYWNWNTEHITHWRLHNAACGTPPKSLEVALEIPPEHRKSLEDAYDHLNTGNWQDTQPKRMSAKEYIETLQPLVDEQPIGLPLNRVCKAFTAITGHPMSEEHVETFLKVVEMCKLYAAEDDF